MLQSPRSRLLAIALVSLMGTPVAPQESVPAVASNTIWIGQVQRGDVVQQVRGPGALERFGRGFHAHVRIAARQATDVELDQHASVNLRPEVLEGRVVHIEDRVEEGTVAVIVAITGDMPDNLRPGLSVDVRIDTGALEDVLWVERPAFAQANQTTGIFKLTADDAAERVAVTWGAASVEKIVVASGLAAGDRIILSDMSRYD